jgi:hypothetical protein
MDGSQYTSAKIANSVNIARQKSPQIHNGRELPKAAINQLFGVMRLNYPSFLNDTTDGDVAATKKFWWSYLKHHDESLINKATRNVVIKFKKFAPTLGEFQEMLEEIAEEPVARQQRDTDVCEVCRSYTFTQHHHDICITGRKSIYQVTDEQIAEAKKMFKGLR